MPDPMTTYNGTPLSQMTSRQLMGVIEEMKRKQQGWQEIATAPKDGTTLLLTAMFDGPHDWRTKVGGWNVYFGHWEIPGASWTPQFWMPLPEAPNAHPKG